MLGIYITTCISLTVLLSVMLKMCLAKLSAMIFTFLVNTSPLTLDLQEIYQCSKLNMHTRMCEKHS